MNDRIFATRQIPGNGLKLLEEKFQLEVWKNETPPSKDQILKHTSGCSGIITLLSDQIDSDIIRSLPDLKVISQYAVGFDNIDIETATKQGIIVTNTPGVLTETTADLTWALILAASRRVVEADRYVRDGKWKVAWDPQMLVGKDVFGATLGIIGLGRIGSSVAQRASGFSMKILYHTRSENERTRRVEDETGARRTDLDKLLSQSDIVSIHAPLSDATNKMIGKRELEMMKPDAVLINTSRGALLDEDALIAVLKSGHLSSVGLDVFSLEPTPVSNELLSLPNVVLSPHIGSASITTRSRMGEMCAENLITALDGKRPPHIVNPEVLDL
ncbi:MAG: 2-hydroxyacid dehydrogenase [Candidatus Thorarchaeota archaeon]